MAEAAQADGFGVQETHGILWRPENRIYAKSDGLGWTSLYASIQRETPYEAQYAGVRDHLIILHLNGPVGVSRILNGARARRVIPPGGLFIMPGGLDFRVKLEGDLDTVHIYLRRWMVEEVAAGLGFRDPRLAEITPHMGDQDPLMEQLALGVREALETGRASDAAYVEHLARALAARLLKKYSVAATAEPANAKGGLTRAQIDRAVDFMVANLASPLTLQDIAAGVGLSPAYFARAFKAALGAPPHQHLMRIRVDRAKRLLSNEDEPIADVALACGFSHQEHLTRVFRRLTGLTPAAYRRFSRI